MHEETPSNELLTFLFILERESANVCKQGEGEGQETLS